MRRRLAAGLVLGLVIAGAASSAPPATVTTVLTVKGSVSALALDGTKIAWFSSETRCPSLHMLDAVTKHDSPVKLQQGACDDLSPAVHDRMALAGNQVLYGLQANGNRESGVDLFVADVRTGKIRDVGGVGIPGGHDADDPYVPVPIEGGSRLLAFGEFSAGALSDRVVYRVDGTKPLSLPTTSGVTALDADAGRLAVVRTLPGGCICNADAHVSPDGKRIAFVSGQGLGGLIQRSVYVVNSDGSGLRRLGGPDHLSLSPAWSPDGSAVVYEDRTTFMVVVETPGGARTDLGAGESPSWSPNGNRVGFVASDAKTDDHYVVIVNRDGTNRRRVIKADDFDWSPVGNQLLIPGYDGHYKIVGADGKNPTLLGRNGLFASWSPDGTRVALFALQRPGLFVVRLSDGNVRKIANTAGSHLRWSRDGLHLAFEYIVPDSLTTSPATAAVWVVPADGSSPPAVVTPGSEPDWSTDGERLVFTRPLANSPDTQIATVARDGSDVRNVMTTRPAVAQSFVEVRSASGKVLSHVKTDATAVLLSGPLLVDRAVNGVEVRNASTGALVRTLRTPAGAGTMVLAGRWLAYGAGHSVRLLDSRTGKTSVLATTTGPLVGLSASGKRIAWVERGKSSRIRTALLPQ
jgi:Tol biopolymer transport system component